MKPDKKYGVILGREFGTEFHLNLSVFFIRTGAS